MNCAVRRTSSSTSPISSSGLDGIRRSTATPGRPSAPVVRAARRGSARVGRRRPRGCRRRPAARLPGLSAAGGIPGREPGRQPGLVERAGADLWRDGRARGDHRSRAGIARANRTGRPFTGDYAGELLYATLIAFGFASGVYDRRPDDGLTLIDCAIVNAVRCVPPQNKPTPEEIGSLSPLPRARDLGLAAT